MTKPKFFDLKVEKDPLNKVYKIVSKQHDEDLNLTMQSNFSNKEDAIEELKTIKKKYNVEKENEKKKNSNRNVSDDEKKKNTTSSDTKRRQ
jgi:hypothetical protein